MKAISFTLLLALLAPGALASVRFTDWRSESLASVADRAARERVPVVLIVTQPDWCPPCIVLDRKWLKNPDDRVVADLTKDAIVLEAHGYDRPDADILRKHGIQFRGTPTTFVFAPRSEGELLGRAPLLGSVLGAPEDFPDQLARLIAGDDAVGDLERAIERAPDADRVGRAKLMLQLGDLLAARGDGPGAYLTYRRVRRLHESGLSREDREALDELQREAAWRQADTALLRVRKDYEAALREIRGFENTFVARESERERIAYAKAWAMAMRGDVRGALDVLDAGLPDTAGGAETFAYFCFRSEEPRALVAGERRVAEAMRRYPEQMATWLAARGRIERRQGRLAEAEASFATAIELQADPEERLVVEGQLAHVRQERSQAAVAIAATPEPEPQPRSAGLGR